MDSSGSVTLDVQLKIGDLYWIYVMRAVTTGWFVRGYLALALIFLLALAPEHLAYLVPFILPPMLLLILGLIFYFLLVRPYLSARTFVQHTADGGSVYYTFSQAGIDVRGAHSETNYQWPAVGRAKQTAHLFILYLSKSSAIVLPKRCFTSVEEIAIFQNLVKSKVIRNRTVHTNK
jgi:hypothetical protein